MNQAGTSWWSWFDWAYGQLPAFWFNPGGWITGEACRTLSYVLLHSLWQGAMLSAMLWGTLRWVPSRWTATRYVVSTLLLVGVVVSSCVTAAILELPSTRGAKAVAVTVSSSVATPLHSEPGLHQVDAEVEKAARVIAGTGSAASPSSEDTGTKSSSYGFGDGWISWTRWVAWGWLLGAVIMLARVGGSLLQTRRLVQDSAALPSGLLGPFESLVDELRGKLQIGYRVRLACSDWLNVPAVCGTIWPVLLMPTAMLTGIPLDQWRVILAHELAHVRRHDYFVNVFQMLIEAVYFFNPAVWWISRQIRIEREACCDALAVEVTGQPLAVARALVNVADWVRRGSGRSPKTLVAWQSVDGNESPGELTDRVKRIAQPETAPRLRMPWYSVFGVFAVSACLFLCLQLGADVAVKAVAQVLSPRERVEKLIALDRQLAGQTGANDTVAAGEKGDPPVKIEPIKVAGVITMADGSKVPAKTNLNGLEIGKGSTKHSTLVHDIKDGSNATFSLKCFPPTKLYLMGQTDGFAPVIVGPIQIQAEKTVEPQKVVFERGFPAAIRVLDSRKKQIVGAKVSARIEIRYENGASGTGGFPEVQSDAQGMIHIAHAQAKYPYDVSLEVPGYQWSQHLFSLQPNQTVDWEIPTAKLTTGQVVSDDTGAPVAGAELLLIEARREPRPGNTISTGAGDPRTSYASHRVLTTTNAEGRFELNTLADGVDYRLYVRSKEHRPFTLDDVVAGDAYPAIRLQPPLIVKGRILGADKLPKQHGDTEDTRKLAYGNLFKPASNWTTYSSGIQFPVKIVNGVGHFELRELFATKLTLMLGSRSEQITLEKSIDDWVIDLNQAPDSGKPVKTRKVVLNLVGLMDASAVSGKLQVAWQGSGVPYAQVHLTVKNGRVEADVPVGASIYVTGKHLIGCWIKRTSDLLVEDDSEPLAIDLEAVPAGAIQGRVRNQDGTQCDGFDATVVMSSTPTSIGQSSLLEVESREAVPGKFLFQQLPLGGTYRILIRSRDPGSLAAILSDPVTLDEATPIQSIELKFSKGKKLVVKVLDEAGQPAANVGVQFGYSVSGDRASHGFSKSLGTTAEGLAVFEQINWETLEHPRLEISHTKTRQGDSIALDPSEGEITVQLKRGVPASGVLIDVATGRPVAHAELRLSPKDYQQAGYLGWIGVKTNAQGKFHFENLAPREYRMYIDGADPVGRIYTPLPNGRYSISGSGEFPTIEGGTTEPVRVEVQLRPDSKLNR